MTDDNILPFPTKDVIEQDVTGQAEVAEAPVNSELPSLADEAHGAVLEGDALLERLSEGYVTFGAGDPEAEVIRALVSVVRGYAEIATISLLDIRAYAEERLAAIG